MSTYRWLLALIVTGSLLVPVAGMAILLALPDPRHPDRVPTMRRRSRDLMLRGLLGLGSLHGTHWLLRLLEWGYPVVATWGWVMIVLAAGLLLPPAAVVAIAVRNRPDPTPMVALGAVFGLSLVQAPYWLMFGLWASVDLLARLTR